MKYNVLILGASYGSLFSTKLLMAGHGVSLVCTRPTAELINREGTVVRFPIRGRQSPVDISSKKLPGALRATTPDEVDPREFELIVLGMQEAQYGTSGVRELMRWVAESRIPCLAIMNMPPLAYLKRIPGLQTDTLSECYADPDVWKSFVPGLITLSSPDPQAFRPPDHPKNVLHVGLPTNFKAAPFDADEPTKLLRNLEVDIEEARFDPGDGPIEIPVKLKVHDSIFVPLAKWPMLMAGNYRSIRRDIIIPIKDAVHDNLDKSRQVYDWVWKLCTRLTRNLAPLFRRLRRCMHRGDRRMMRRPHRLEHEQRHRRRGQVHDRRQPEHRFPSTAQTHQPRGKRPAENRGRAFGGVEQPRVGGRVFGTECICARRREQ